MAGRTSLLVAFFAMLLSTLIGTLVGVIAGYRGGWIGAALMRTVDGFLSFPSIFLLLALAAARAEPRYGHRHRRYHQLDGGGPNRRGGGTVIAPARVCVGRAHGGVRGTHIMFREILPNAMGPIIVAATLTVGTRNPAGSLYQFPGLWHSAAAAGAGATCSRAPSSIWTVHPGWRSSLGPPTTYRRDKLQLHRRRTARCARRARRSSSDLAGNTADSRSSKRRREVDSRARARKSPTRIPPTGGRRHPVGPLPPQPLARSRRDDRWRRLRGWRPGSR